MTLPASLVQMTAGEQSMWEGLLSSKLVIAHTAPNPDPEQPPTSHVMVRWFNVPGEEQLILYYGNDGNDGFRAVWAESVKAQEWPEVRAVRSNNNWELQELFEWLGGPADQVTEEPTLDNSDLAQMYGIPASLDLETIYQQYLGRFDHERGAGCIPMHNQPMPRPEFWTDYAVVLGWLEGDGTESDEEVERINHLADRLLIFRGLGVM